MDGLAAPPATLDPETGKGGGASFDERKVRIEAVDASTRTMRPTASQILRRMKPLSDQEVLPQHWFARSERGTRSLVEHLRNRHAGLFLGNNFPRRARVFPDHQCGA